MLIEVVHRPNEDYTPDTYVRCTVVIGVCRAYAFSRGRSKSGEGVYGALSRVTRSCLRQIEKQQHAAVPSA